MDNSQLVKRHCVPCEGGVEPLSREERSTYLSLLKTPWEVSADTKSISQTFKFNNFVKAMEFINKIADIAEEQGHHPDIKIVYNKVTIKLTTHAIKGLSPNDFIVASKIEILPVS